VPLVSDDKRGVEAAHAGSSPDAKAAALRAYRRALGLCYKCSEKWTKDHRCSSTVQLHAVQELWELFQLEDDSDYVSPVAEDMFEHVFLAISKAAVRGSDAPRTVKFVGSIQHKSVTLLVDSGRSSSFISASVAAQLSGVFPLPTSVTGQVAGGSTLSCEAVIPQALWFINDVAFQSDLRVLPLMAYDIIIGMDWLESFSPMRVHWKQKWLEIPYEGRSLTLQGVVPIQAG
jgi:hypothetical protein